MTNGDDHAETLRVRGRGGERTQDVEYTGEVYLALDVEVGMQNSLVVDDHREYPNTCVRRYDGRQ